MSNVKKLKRSEVLSLCGNFESVQKVTISPEDDKSDYMTFKMVAGLNFNTFFKRCEKIQRELAAMESPLLYDKEYSKYREECDEYVAKHYGKKDDSGNYILDEEGQLELTEDPDLSSINVKYPRVLESIKKTHVAVDKYLRGRVSVKVEQFPLEKIPSNINGSYLNSIKCMIN